MSMFTDIHTDRTHNEVNFDSTWYLASIVKTVHLKKCDEIVMLNSIESIYIM